MALKIGVWVDHRHAILVKLQADSEVVEVIDSDVEKHVRESGGSRGGTASSAQDTEAGDQRDRKFANHLNTYYDEVIQHLDHADGILILGPGEAKGELNKRITSKALREKVLDVETADKMTTPQLVAKVRSYFQK